jgi:PAS domain S-box-containing protein
MLGRAGIPEDVGVGDPVPVEPRRELLRRLASGEPLAAVLKQIVLAIEARVPGITASVQLLEQGRLKHGAAPGLPEAYNRAADNHPIGEGFGSCGTAAYRRTMVVVEDTQIDPLWKGYRELARRYGIGACWSKPLLDPAGEVLGTIALYYHQPRRPHRDELVLIEEFAALTTVVLYQHRQANALAERDRRFRELVEDIDGVVWEANSDLSRFERVSPRAERLFGHPLERWLEPGFWQSVVHPEDRPATVRHQQQALLSTDRCQLEYRVLKPGGAVVWVRNTIRVQWDGEGRPRQLRGVMVDISAQREAEQAHAELEQRLRGPAAPPTRTTAREAPAAASRTPRSSPTPAREPSVQDSAARLRVLADAATTLGSSLDVERLPHDIAALSVRELADACLVFTRDRDGTVTCAALAHRDPTNPVTAKDFDRLLRQPGGMPFGLSGLGSGHVQPTFMGLSPDSFAPGAARPQLLQLVRRMGVASALTLPLQAPDRILGAVVFLAVARTGPTPEQRETAELLVSRAALALANAHLYHEAQLAIAQREEFLSVAAHELKTPLASLQLTLQTMAMVLDLEKCDTEFLRGRVRAGERQAGRLGRLIHDLLDVSVMYGDHLQLEREPTDLTERVEAALVRMKGVFARKHVDVTLHAGSPVLGEWDPRRLDQMITNLLSNAMKYGNQRPVHITVRDTDRGASLQIDDAGMGMSGDVLERLFRPFERGVSAGHYGGLGLGLYITSQIVRAHQGTIAVRSVPGAGSSFRVELPRRPPS